MRPLGAWSPFELCVRTILGQQVTVAAAGTLMRRLVERCGTVTPECVADANFDSIGMPGKRVETIRSFARAVADGRVDFERPWPEVEAALKALPGFGPWTRAYLAIRLGRDPDAFPETDLGLIRAAQVDSPAQLLALAEALAALSGLCSDLSVGGERKRDTACDPRLDLPNLVTCGTVAGLTIPACAGTSSIAVLLAFAAVKSSRAHRSCPKQIFDKYAFCMS